MPKSKNQKFIRTKIDGLMIYFNKVVKDERGYLCEIAPGGIKNPHFFFDKKKFRTLDLPSKYKSPLFKYGFGDAHAIVFKKIGSSRGGHYHKTNYDLSFILSGTCLCYFYDSRKFSKTYRKEEIFLAGNKSIKLKRGNIKIKDFTIESKKKIALILIPPGIYHIFYSLSKENPNLFVFASQRYNEKDYVRIKPEDLPTYDKLKDLLTSLSIQSLRRRQKVLLKKKF